MFRKLVLVVVLFVSALPGSSLFNLSVPFDVNNVLRLARDKFGDYEEYGEFTVEVNGDARGLPLIGLNRNIYGDSLKEETCCRNWTKDGWKQLTPEESEKTRPLLDHRVQWNDQPVAPIWMLQNTSGFLISPLASSLSQRRVCVTILARLPPVATLSIWAQRVEDNREMRIGEIRGGRTGGWQLRQLVRGAPMSHRNRYLRLIVKAKQKATSKEPLLVQWCSRCTAALQKDSYNFLTNFTSENASSIMKSVMLPTPVKGTVLDPVCRHGGRLDLDYGICHCSPGFTGAVCEKGCGRNRYGVTCTGQCSKESSGRQCGGVKVCTESNRCECVSGWKGESCDQPCPENRYGPSCKMSCGRCKNGESCNRYTGWCEDGCQEGFQPPFCKDVCGKPSALGEALISNGHEANPEEHPWSAALYFIRPDTNPEQICSGSLVRPRFVLSAAHCVYHDVKFIVNPPENYKLGFGKFRRQIDAIEKHPDRIQIRDVRSITVPREYRGKQRQQADDIALFEMFMPVEITPYVRPVCIDSTGGFDPDLYDGDIGDVVGWGQTEFKVPSEILLIANPRFISTEKCFKYVPADFIKSVALGKFCAGDIGGAAVDHGDSGGGLVFDSYIRGIVSSAPEGDYSVTSYVNVSAYRDWFSQIWDRLDVEDAVSKHLILASKTDAKS